MARSWMQFSRSGVVIGGYCAAYGFTADADDVFMIPDGDWSTGLRHWRRRVLWKFSDNMIKAITSQSEKSQRRLGTALGCLCPLLVAYL